MIKAFRLFIKYLHLNIDWLEQNNKLVAPVDMTDANNKLCPLIKSSCIKGACLAYGAHEQEWNETAVVPNEQEPGTVHEIETGNRLRGVVANCRASIFRNWVVKQEVITKQETKSQLISLS